MAAGQMGEQSDERAAEQAAVRLSQRGDSAGLARLVALHQARAVRLAALITHDPHLAEDVVAEALLIAFGDASTSTPAERARRGSTGWSPPRL